MQKLLTLVIFSLLIGIGNANSQTEKSTLLLGGNISFQAVDDASVFILNSNTGVFISNNFAVGLQASIIAANGGSLWALGPYARGYFGKNEKGKPFAQGTFSLGGGSGGGDSEVSLGGGLTAGYAIFLNKNVAVELFANYFRQDDTGLFGLGVGFQIHFKKQK